MEGTIQQVSCESCEQVRPGVGPRREVKVPVRERPDPIEDVYVLTGGACVCHGGFADVCPVDWCRFHLDSQEKRTWKEMPRRRTDDSDTCAIRLANAGPATLEEVAVRLGLTRERVRQIEEKALARMTKGFIRLQLVGRKDVSPERLRQVKISPDEPSCGTTGARP